MIKDYQDIHKFIKTVYKGEESDHEMFLMNPDGSFFIYENHAILVEGRFSPTYAKADLIFPTETFAGTGGLTCLRIKFPSTLITSKIRHEKIYVKVYATDLNTSTTTVVKTGELWLKD